MSEWISVADRLPAWEEAVLLAGWRKGVMTVSKGHRCNVWLDRIFNPWGIPLGGKKLDVVTHWQPLPLWPDPPAVPDFKGGR